MTIRGQQLRYYRTFGFLKFPGHFALEIAAITNAFEEFWAASGRQHDRLKRTTIIPFADRHDDLPALIDDPRINDIAGAVLGDDFNYETSDGNYYVGDTKWHSDKEPTDPAGRRRSDASHRRTTPDPPPRAAAGSRRGAADRRPGVVARA